MTAQILIMPDIAKDWCYRLISTVSLSTANATSTVKIDSLLLRLRGLSERFFDSSHVDG